MNYWVLIYRFAWCVLVVLCIVGVICIFLPECQTHQELQDKKARLVEEAGALESSIKELQRKQEKLPADRSFVERTARELGMAKPGETVFKAPQESTNTTTGDRHD
jgi:cell division protein FtsB